MHIQKTHLFQIKRIYRIYSIYLYIGSINFFLFFPQYLLTNKGKVKRKAGKDD